VNLVQIARRIGVSKSTVWRALNNAGDIRPEKRAMVLRKIQEFGYQPNLAARALVTGTSRSVLVWLAALAAPVVTRVIHAIESLLAKSRYEMIVRSRESYYPSDPAALLQWPVAGIVAWDVIDIVELLRPYIEGASRVHPPIVSAGAYFDTNVDAVGIDLRCGAKAAIHHLCGIGCTRIAYLVTSGFDVDNDPRQKGYLEAIAEEGLEPFIISNPHHGGRGARRAIQDWVRANGHPDGLFCFNDETAMGAYRGLRDAGLRIPEDVALVGCDGIEAMEYLDCPLTTIVQPFQEACDLAWQFVTTRMADPDIHRQFALLKPELVVRASSLRRAHRTVSSPNRNRAPRR